MANSNVVMRTLAIFAANKWQTGAKFVVEKYEKNYLPRSTRYFKVFRITLLLSLFMDHPSLERFIRRGGT